MTKQNEVIVVNTEIFAILSSAKTLPEITAVFATLKNPILESFENQTDAETAMENHAKNGFFTTSFAKVSAIAPVQTFQFNRGDLFAAKIPAKETRQYTRKIATEAEIAEQKAKGLEVLLSQKGRRSDAWEKAVDQLKAEKAAIAPEVAAPEVAAPEVAAPEVAAKSNKKGSK